jgi:hypothetical protein
MATRNMWVYTAVQNEGKPEGNHIDIGNTGLRVQWDKGKGGSSYVQVLHMFHLMAKKLQNFSHAKTVIWIVLPALTH